MNKKQKNPPADRRGFTLIELLVVIAIIGILAAIGLSALTSARKKARDSKRKSDMREVSTALELYYADNGYYPKVTTGYADLTDVSTGVLRTYLSTAPQDPLTTQFYCYGVSSDGLYYRIGAELEVGTDTSATNDGGPNDALYEAGNATGSNAGEVSSTDCKE